MEQVRLACARRGMWIWNGKNDGEGTHKQTNVVDSSEHQQTIPREVILA